MLAFITFLTDNYSTFEGGDDCGVRDLIIIIGLETKPLLSSIWQQKEGYEIPDPLCSLFHRVVCCFLLSLTIQ